MNSFSFEPIGTVHCSFRHRFEAARQGVFSENAGRIDLFPHRNYETALEDLNGFERIWVLFAFHLNSNWKPKVTPPVVSDHRRIGVFATRSPHRPNPIGMSCVQLETVEGLTLHIRNFDMLDGSPVFDIKPYIPEADAFPGSKAGWRDEIDRMRYELSFSMDALRKMEWIREHAGLDLENFCRIQLIRDPASNARKRVESAGDGTWTIGCRTWRIAYRIAGGTVEIFQVCSNYPPEELTSGAPDRYGDKEFHRAFRKEFEL